MNRTGVLAILLFSKKYKVLLFIAYAISVISICVLGAVYSSESVQFRVVLAINVVLLFVIAFLGTIDLARRCQKERESKELDNN